MKCGVEVMQNIETSYSSYQELLLDLDIFGRLMGLQNLDDKEAFKELLFQEYVKAHPLPTSEGMDCELSEPVSSDYHVSYIQELELSQREEVMNFDEDDDEDEDAEEEEQIEEEQEVDSHLDERYKASVDEVEDFTGSVEEVENNFGTIETEEPSEEPEESNEDAEEEFEYDEDGEETSEVYSDEDEDGIDYSDDGYDDQEEEISYDDDDEEEYPDEQEPEEDTYEYDEDGEEQDGYSSEEADNIEDFIEEPTGFVDSVYDNPTPVKVQPRDVEVNPPPVGIPNNRGTPKEEEVDRASLPSDVLQYLRQHPRCEISEVLKYYPRKELEKYIRTGRVIKKGSKVYI